MKNIKIFAIGAALTLGLASCSDSYFNPDMDQNKTSETAFNTAQDVKNGVITRIVLNSNLKKSKKVLR